MASEPRDGLPLAARRRSMAVILLGMVVSVLDSTVITLALPGIARDLQSAPAASVWIINGYQLVSLALLLPFAALGDRVGHRRVYLLGTALFTFASALCFVANSLPALVLARCLAGVGAAGLMSANGALLRLTVPRRLFAQSIGINAAVIAASSVAGPSVAAAVLSVATWPWLFMLNLPTGLLILVVGWFVLPANEHDQAQQERIPGMDVLLNVLMFSLVVLGAQSLGGLVGAPRGGLEMAGPLALLGAGLLVGVVHLRRQLHRRHPLFPVDLLRIPLFALSIGTSVTSFAAQTLAFVALPFLLLDVWHLNPGQAGLLLTAWPLAVVVAAPVAGRLLARYPGGLLGAVGLAAMSLGLLLLALLPQAPDSLAIAWRLALCGLGFGLFQSPNNHTLLTTAPLHRSGAAGGMLGTARLTGQTLGAVSLVFVFSLAHGAAGRGPLFALGLASVFAALASTVSALRLRYQRRPAA